MVTTHAAEFGRAGCERAESGNSGRPDPVGRIMGRLGRDHGEREIGRYFAEQARIIADDAGVEVTVPSEFAAGFLDRRFGRSLREAAREALGADDAHGVRFRVDQSAFDSKAAGLATAETTEQRAEPRPSVRQRPAPRMDDRREQYRFETFLVSESNRVAHGAAAQLVDSEEGRHAPLFLHGPCGVGKTHLIHGVAQRFRERHPGAKVCCTTGESFTQTFVAALRGGSIEQFRRAHRGLHLLCIDDVHLIAGKSATQTELLHTFDTLNLEGARIILASDCHPRQTVALGQALASRFMAGAVIRIDPPDAALCARLVALHAARRGLAIEPGASSAIASRVASTPGCSARDIEGVIAQIEAVWRTMAELRSPTGGVGMHIVDRALGTSGVGPRVSPRRAITPDRVVHAICASFGVTASEMGAKGRHPRVVFARAVAAYLSRELTNASYPEIARAVGRPTHSTIVAADKKLRTRLEEPHGVSLSEEFAGLTVRGVCARIAEDLARPGFSSTSAART